MLRGFTDSTGVEWRVWEVFPNKGSDKSNAELSRSSLKDTAFANGWLCFESSGEKRRLAPIPDGWEFRDAGILQELRDSAIPVAPLRRSGDRRTPGAA
jgi:hypothetical protein